MGGNNKKRKNDCKNNAGLVTSEKYTKFSKKSNENNSLKKPPTTINFSFEQLFFPNKENLSLENFINDHFQKKFTIFSPSNDIFTSSSLNQIFTLKDLVKLAEKMAILDQFDFCASKVVNGIRENYKNLENKNGEKNSDEQKINVILPEEIRKLTLEKKYTIQLHQPQRFVPIFHSILLAFENFFNTIVGANIYLTPNNSQGLKPHYDNVDVFIVQLNGKKKWTLWHPTNEDHMMPIGEASKDLEPELLDEMMEKENLYEKSEFILEVGQVLYMPRGTIHCAKAVENSEKSVSEPDSCSYSNHITISCFESDDAASYLESKITDSLLPLLSEQKLWLRQSGQQNLLLPKTSQNQKEVLKSLLTKFYDSTMEILNNESENPNNEELSFEIINDLTDKEKDFFQNRLPPLHVNSGVYGKQPGHDAMIKFVFPDRILIREENPFDDGEEESDEEDGGDDDDWEDDKNEDDDDDENDENNTENTPETDYFFIFTSQNNPKMTHMITDKQEYAQILQETIALDPNLAHKYQKYSDRLQKEVSQYQSLGNSPSGIKLEKKRFMLAAETLLEFSKKQVYVGAKELNLLPMDFMQLAMSLYCEGLIHTNRV